METNLEMRSAITAARSDHAWVLVVIINMAGVLAFAKVSEIPPIIPLLSKELKVSYERLGVLMSLYAFIRIAGNYGVGWLTDKLGARLVVMLGLLCLGVSGFLFTLVSNYWLLMVFTILLVVGVSAIVIAGYDAMTKIMPGKRMGLGVGLFDASISLGAAGALLFTPILSDWYGWRWALRLSTFASLVLVVVLLFTLKRNAGTARKADSMASAAIPSHNQSNLTTVVTLLSIATCLVYFQGYGMFTWVPSYLKDVLHYSPSDVGTASMLFGLLSIPSAIISGRLAKSFRSMIYVSVTGTLISSLAILLLFAHHGWSRTGVACLIALMTWGRTQAIIPIISLIALTTPPKSVGKALGKVFAIAYIGATLSTYLGGFIISRTRNYNLTFAVFAAATLIGAFVIGFTKTMIKTTEQGVASAGAIE